MAERPRRPGVDTLRGLALLSMIAYHGAWDLVYLFGVDWAWYRSFGAYLWQQSICWTFILLSGFCARLGHHRLRRGLYALGGGALVSGVTALFLPEGRIFCGVLTFLGLAALIAILLEGVLRRVPPRMALAVSFTLFLLTWEVNGGYLGFAGARLAALPRWLYRNSLTAVLGFPPAGFASSDYFSLFPWLFLYFTGYFLFSLRRDTRLTRFHLPVVSAMGRHSLLIYLLHQPLLYGVLRVLLAAMG